MMGEPASEVSRFIETELGSASSPSGKHRGGGGQPPGGPAVRDRRDTRERARHDGECQPLSVTKREMGLMNHQAAKAQPVGRT